MPRHWLDIPLAPLHWLERARGRRRVALAGLYGLILGVLGVVVRREAVLWQLPAAPEPFDLVRSGHVDLPDADNAMVLYRRADQLRVNLPELFRDLPAGAGLAWDWRQSDPRILPWIEANRPALDVWRQATARPDSLFVQPAEFTYTPSFAVFDGISRLSQLATLEATRRQAAGDLEGAWIDYRAVIRAAHHAGRHAGRSASATGAGILRQAIPSIMLWADEPELPSALLREAIADLARCRALEATAADMIRVEYFATRAALGDRAGWEKRQLNPNRPGFSWPSVIPAMLRGKYFWDHEPERSRHILRLITLGQLAQVERPVGARPPIVSQDYLIYAIDAATPSSVARIRPEVLAAWADASGCWGVLPELGAFLGSNTQLRSSLDRLRIRLAERAYALDHAGQPARTYGDLRPTYLDVLPEGIAAADVLTAP